MASRQCSYFYQYQDDPAMFVYVDEVDRNYSTSRVFVGPLNNMVELPVDQVVRYRDGGTTKISIMGSDDMFCFPAKCRTDIQAVHGDRVLVERNKEDLPIMNFQPIPLLENKIKKQQRLVEQSKNQMEWVAGQIEYYQELLVEFQRRLVEDTANHRREEAKLEEMMSQFNH
jgi:hypothetical protein